MPESGIPASTARGRVARGPVSAVHYAPPPDHGLDVELYPAAELRRRVLSVAERGAERIDFLCLLYVSAGRYSHMVDFEIFDCAAGSVLALQPGQVHRFGNMRGWDGWTLVFRSELLRAGAASMPTDDLELFRDITELPAHVRLSGSAISSASTKPPTS
ncbi:MAG: AraC family ligand binding domain-containing protein [Burkholderiaceae bacterium]|nr:AraC family ligand binding domain-containing protein [Burkholderiaceae bacterium]